ncbi:hypothetical protein ACRJ4W_17440 [Streptomyces sp. GLT-R25]
MTGLTTRWTSSVAGVIALGSRSRGCSEPEPVAVAVAELEAVTEPESEGAVAADGGVVNDETLADPEFATCSTELVTDRTTSVGFEAGATPSAARALLPAEEPQHEQPAHQQRHLQRTPLRRRARHAQSGIGQYG